MCVLSVNSGAGKDGRCAIAASGITRVARARSHNRRGPGVLQEYRDIIKLFRSSEYCARDSGWVPLPDAVCDGRRDADYRHALPVVTVDLRCRNWVI